MASVVVGYVPTAEGEAALAQGINEAKLRGATLLVVNSRRGGGVIDEGQTPAEPNLRVIEDRLRSAGVKYEVRGLVRGNDPADDVVAVAEETSADLIVIGLRRRSPVGKLIMGSKAQRILLDAPCPVLAVKQNPPG